ncbi:Protein of unknown function [Cotesia congregata]|uniref:Uncharacterized protein n=1 Tax=Cotesia congregata TaxID=51543 RepID=A0A8J2HT20_COTCN|nr:Protein of unknown function [Cotesia congregata]
MISRYLLEGDSDEEATRESPEGSNNEEASRESPEGEEDTRDPPDGEDYTRDPPEGEEDTRDHLVGEDDTRDSPEGTEATRDSPDGGDDEAASQYQNNAFREENTDNSHSDNSDSIIEKNLNSLDYNREGYSEILGVESRPVTPDIVPQIDGQFRYNSPSPSSSSSS